MFADVSRHRSTDDAQILFEEKRMEKFASERFQKPGYERKLFWSAPRCTKSRSLFFFSFLRLTSACHCKVCAILLMTLLVTVHQLSNQAMER